MKDIKVRMYSSGSLNLKSVSLGRKNSSGIYKLKLLVDDNLSNLNKFIVINNKAYNINDGLEVNKTLTNKNNDVYFILSSNDINILKGNVILKSEKLKLEVN